MTHLAIDAEGKIHDLRRGVILKTRSDGRGYLCVTVDGITHKAHKVACIVAHGEKPTPKHIVMHRDNKKTNNAPSNIFWGLPSENMQQAHDDGLMNHERKARVIVAKIKGKKRLKFMSITSAAKFFEKSPGTIHSALSGKSKTAAGYEWSYA